MRTVVDLCYTRENLLCLLEIFCLMPRTKFGSDTMLNINIIINDVIYQSVIQTQLWYPLEATDGKEICLV